MSAPKEQGETSGRRNRSRQSDASGQPPASVNLDELREAVKFMEGESAAHVLDEMSAKRKIAAKVSR